ncbi:hypothetical protein [Devosia sp. A449]
MAHIDSSGLDSGLLLARKQARQSAHVQRAQLMLLAAGMAAIGIVAVAAAMMTTVF